MGEIWCKVGLHEKLSVVKAQTIGHHAKQNFLAITVENLTPVEVCIILQEYGIDQYLMLP